MTQEHMLNPLKIAEIVVEFVHSSNRLFLLDYDGTLVNIQSSPDKVVPTERIMTMLKAISSDPKNTVAIITGRDQYYIHNFFGDMNLFLFAEHGSFMKRPGADWINLYNGNQDWKQKILPIINDFTEKNPGAITEEKVSSIAWHYRNINPDNIFDELDKLYHKLMESITSDMNITILKGKKVLEVKQNGFDKGTASNRMMSLNKFQFILSIGDDVTDEDMFKALPGYAHSFKVGPGLTWAKMSLENTEEVIQLLENFT